VISISSVRSRPRIFVTARSRPHLLSRLGIKVMLGTVNQHPPVHHEGWMRSGQETVFCWVSVP
jgi:hypothetical protein